MKQLACAAALGLVACARPEGMSPVSPLSRAPDVRVGIAVNQRAVTLGGGDGLVLANNQAGWVGEVSPAQIATVESRNGALEIQVGERVLPLGPTVTVAPSQTGSLVRLNGREYRGTLLLVGSVDRVTAINVVDLEDYLVGVVGAEMGLRSEEEIAALEAQAVISRTIALQRTEQWRARDYDLVATVADQLYPGRGQESPLAAQAVAATRGLVLTYQGRIIDGFFHSTCAGRTAAGTEVFAGADRPYLRSISDLDSSGRAWCAISPRYRWRETWSGDELARILAQTLPLAGGPAGLAEGLRDLRILERTATDRVARLEFRGVNGSLVLSGPAARGVLRSGDGSVLRSTDFTLQISRDGERIVQLSADGAGAGHAVGLCQWGAIGRARAGMPYGAILAAYFPGTELSRTY